MFDFSSLWSSFYGQVFIVLAIVGTVVIIVGLITQGIGKTLGIGAGLVLVGVLFVCLDNMQAISEWFTNSFLKIGG